MQNEPQKRREARENKDAMSTSPPASPKRELARPEWRKQLAQRPRTDLGVDALALLAEERARRDTEMGMTRTWSHRTLVWGSSGHRRRPGVLLLRPDGTAPGGFARDWPVAA